MQVLTTHVRTVLAKLALFALIAATPLTSSLAAVVNFDNVAAAAGGTLFPGNQFAAQGVTFTSGNISSTVDTVGEIFTLAGPDTSSSSSGTPTASRRQTSPRPRACSARTTIC